MNAQYSSQSGMVLVTSLVILMILTMLGLSSVQGTSIQELISRNQRDSNLAFNAVETALVEAEATLSGLSNASWQAIVGGDYASSTSPKIYNAKALGSFFANAVDPDFASSAYANSLQASLSNVAVQPVYMIEHIGTVTSDEDRLNIDNIGQNPNTCCTQMFRITAQGSGGTSSAVVMLQSSYGKRF